MGTREFGRFITVDEVAALVGLSRDAVRGRLRDVRPVDATRQPYLYRLDEVFALLGCRDFRTEEDLCTPANHR